MRREHSRFRIKSARKREIQTVTKEICAKKRERRQRRGGWVKSSIDGGAAIERADLLAMQPRCRNAKTDKNEKEEAI